MNAQAKYVAVNIPVPLMRRIEKLVTMHDGFISATDYTTYVLRVILSRRPEENDYDLFSNRDLDEISARLIALGALSKRPEYDIEDMRPNLESGTIVKLPPKVSTHGSTSRRKF